MIKMDLVAMFLKLVFFQIMKEMRYKHAGLLKKPVILGNKTN